MKTKTKTNKKDSWIDITKGIVFTLWLVTSSFSLLIGIFDGHDKSPNCRGALSRGEYFFPEHVLGCWLMEVPGAAEEESAKKVKCREDYDVCVNGRIHTYSTCESSYNVCREVK